jgi:hypothetical protein
MATSDKASKEPKEKPVNDIDKYLQEQEVQEELKEQQPERRYPEKEKLRAVVPKDDRPTVSVLKGRFGKFKLPASLTLSTMMLPPLTRRRSAIYQQLEFGVRKDGRIIDGSQFIDSPPLQLHPIYTVYDEFETDLARKNKVMVYSDEIRLHEYINPITSNKETGTQPKIGMPEFVNGQVMVDCEAEYPKYVWWELHPRNESNKHRDKRLKPLFKRVDTEYKSPHVQLIEMDLQLQAENYVIKLDTLSLQALAAAFGMPASTSASDMRVNLRTKVRGSTDGAKEVLFKSPDKKAATMINIISALDLGIIDYDPSTTEYMFQHEKESFFVVPLEQTPIEGLVMFLSSPEGQEYKQQIEEMLGYWR